MSATTAAGSRSQWTPIAAATGGADTDNVARLEVQHVDPANLRSRSAPALTKVRVRSRSACRRRDPTARNECARCRARSRSTPGAECGNRSERPIRRDACQDRPSPGSSSYRSVSTGMCASMLSTGVFLRNPPPESIPAGPVAASRRATPAEHRLQHGNVALPGARVRHGEDDHRRLTRPGGRHAIRNGLRERAQNDVVEPNHRRVAHADGGGKGRIDHGSLAGATTRKGRTMPPVSGMCGSSLSMKLISPCRQEWVPHRRTPAG